MKKIYFADFETKNKKDKNGQIEKSAVYLWCIISSINNYSKHGYTISSFISELKNIKGIVFFHNLKFDFSFIHYYLLKNNITYKLLEKSGQIYSVKFFDIELRDSMNYFVNMSLSEVGENYCSKYKKTSIDYDVDFSHKATKVEIEYCFNDCLVLEEGYYNYFNEMKDLFDNIGISELNKTIHNKITNAGIAFSVFRKMSFYDNAIIKTTLSQYRLFSPAYKGGYVYSNNIGIKENVKMIDVNSLYPFIYSTIQLPIGQQYYCIDESILKTKDFYIVKIFCRYTLKDGYIPIIGGGIGKYGGIQYKSESNGFEELTICNKDFELIKRFYDIEYEILWGFWFNTTNKLFSKYTKIFLNIKNNNKGIKRTLAKIMLNSVYGKTAMNGLHEIKKYYLKNGIVHSSITGYEVQDESFKYLPIAMAITAGAREFLLSSAEKIGFENILYMDTDSIKYIDNGENYIETDPNILGMWKDEGTAELFKTISPKKYCYYMDGKIYFTCAGFSKKSLKESMYHGKEVSKNTALKLMAMFDNGLKIKCLQSLKVCGGRALKEVEKEIR